jgi:hypothetical protein
MTQASSEEDAHVPQPSTEALLDEQVCAAPEPLRSYIQELERQADPARNLRELVCGREERKMLGLAIVELEQAICTHRDAQSPDERRIIDVELYKVVDVE